MEKMRYEDFDLFIEPFGKRYKARVLNSPAGQAGNEFSLPFRQAELEKLIQTLDEYRRYARPMNALQEPSAKDMVKDFGSKLFHAIFKDEMLSCLRRSIDIASHQGAGLRLRLRLTEAPQLVNLPWEYLHLPSLNRFFSLSTETPIVRYLDLPERIQSLEVKSPIKILAMLSSPFGYSPLDVEHEWENLRQALGDLERRRLVTLDKLPDAKLPTLQRKLRQQEYHIFHFIGHGVFDEQTQEYGLVLEDENSKGRFVPAQLLGTLLHDERTLRLAVLNACEGARHLHTDPFTGTAQRLVQQGIPAVIAMQFEITDEAAITFAREFYSAVADGHPVDAALAEARKAIYVQGNEVEWATPVLYMRSPDGMIFDMAKAERDALEPQMTALERQQPARLSLKSLQAPIPNLLPYLSDRSYHETELGKALQAQQQSKRRRPFICIIHGDEFECHDMFLERMRLVSLPRALKLDTERVYIKDYLLQWPSAVETRQNHFDLVRSHHAAALVGDSSASVQEMSTVLSRHEAPVMIHTHLLTEDWQYTGPDLLSKFFKFWNNWQDLAPKQFIFICLSQKYQRSEKRGFLQNRKFKIINRTVRDFFATFDFSIYDRLYCVTLPELRAILRKDVEDWVREHAREFCYADELLPRIRALYEQAGLCTPEGGIPMERLAVKLKELLNEYRC